MKKIHIGIIAGVAILTVVLILSLSPKSVKDPGAASAELYWQEAEKAFSSGKLLKARDLYKDAALNVNDTDKLRKIQERLEDVSIKILLSPVIDECSANYIVQPGDALIKIAKKFGTTINLIKRSNNLDSDTIRPGQKLKINTCKFSLVVDKSQNLLFLKRQGEVIKTYTVSTGKDNVTPTGNFHLDNNKLVKPTWYKTGAVIPPDSPDNILGSRWMGLEGTGEGGEDIEGYGIHGTTEPEDLGKQITLGCIRMRNEDIEVLFDIVPVGTEVTIID